ncbi:MAG: BolA family transcriptional regulator [Hyphomicrobiales bacterium]|nr:BolA family transcriptional regulator [Hyphomicrobiales bacterium]
MTVAETIKMKLTAGLAPSELEITDESKHHAGHAGARPEGETHFHVRIVSSQFDHQSRIDRHRQVNALLALELKQRIHALRLTTLTPDEAGDKGSRKE